MLYILNQNFRDNVAKFMTEKGISILELAAETNLSYERLYHYLEGSLSPTLEEVSLIAKFLEIHPLSLLEE